MQMIAVFPIPRLNKLPTEGETRCSRKKKLERWDLFCIIIIITSLLSGNKKKKPDE